MTSTSPAPDRGTNRPFRTSPSQARRRTVGARLHRAAEQERAVQEGRQPAQRPRAHPEHLLQARLRLHRPRRPARPVPLDGPLHPARPGLRRRQDRDARGGGARRRVLHAARAQRRRAARPGQAARPRQHRHRLRPRHRRHHRPREHPVPLDRDRERPGDLGAPRQRRHDQPRGLRRLPAPVPRLPRRRRRRRRDHRRHPGARGDQASLHRQPGVLQPPAQVQDLRQRPPQPRLRPVGQRRLLRRHRAPRARPRLRPVGRRRPVDQPDARAEARRLDPARRGPRRLGGRHLGLPRLRLPPAALARPAEVPRRRLGRGEVPRGARDRVPEAHARRLPLPRGHRPDRRPHRRARRRRTASSTSAPRPSSAASTDRP